MRVDLMTREYPPKVYGGAGVHVTELAQVLRSRLEVRVHCFEGPRTPGSEGADPGVTGYDYLSGLEDSNAAIRTLGVDLAIVKDAQGADLVHSHTWYANMAGHWSKLMYDIPHVVSAHSLEPLRPWVGVTAFLLGPRKPPTKVRTESWRFHGRCVKISCAAIPASNPSGSR